MQPVDHEAIAKRLGLTADQVLDWMRQMGSGTPEESGVAERLKKAILHGEDALGSMADLGELVCQLTMEGLT